MIEKYLPNVYEYQQEFLISILETLQLMVWSGFFSFIFGVILGVLLVITKKGGILENKIIYSILDAFVNIFRSIPFVILIVVVMGLTKIISGTVIGVSGAIFPLVVGCTPFFARQIEMALSEVKPELIEAAESMGVSPLGIIFRVYLKESIPGLARSTSITLISLLGLTAMVGTVGGGGLGAFVLRYGFVRQKTDITWISVLVIILIVTIIELIGNIIIRKTKH